MMNEDTSATSTQAAAVAVEDVTGKRIVAAVIDMVLMFVVFIVFASLFGETEPEGENTEGVNFSLSGAPFLIFLAVAIGYHWLMEAATGKTVGKMVMGLKVVMDDGSPYVAGKAFVRNLLRIVDALPVLYLVGLIVIVSSRKKQRLGDMAAGTLVVKA